MVVRVKIVQFLEKIGFRNPIGDEKYGF